MANLTGKLAALCRRIEQLKREHPPKNRCHWVIPIVEFDSSIPGEEERLAAETEAAARAAGWTPEQGVYAIFLPMNHRDDVVDGAAESHRDYESENKAEQEES